MGNTFQVQKYFFRLKVTKILSLETHEFPNKLKPTEEIYLIVNLNSFMALKEFNLLFYC